MSLKDALDEKDPRVLIPLAVIALLLLFLILPGQNIPLSDAYCAAWHYPGSTVRF
jgi:hypothetical protein